MRPMVEPALDNLCRSEGRLHAVINSAPLAIMEVDLESRVIGWNPAAEQIFGWSRNEMLGRTDTPMVPDWKRDEHERLATAVRDGRVHSHYETVRRHKDGTLVDVAISAAPVRDASGQVVVTDDGVGGADAARGSGLQGLADRVEALGGRLELTSPIGSGTTVSAEIPT